MADTSAAPRGIPGDHVYSADLPPQARELDHQLRLIVGRSTRLPSPDHPALRDLARRLAYASADDLSNALARHMRNIRAAYDRITKG